MGSRLHIIAYLSIRVFDRSLMTMASVLPKKCSVGVEYDSNYIVSATSAKKQNTDLGR